MQWRPQSIPGKKFTIFIVNQRSESFGSLFQTFYLSRDNHLRQEEECAVANGDKVKMVPCGGENIDTWEYTDYHLVNKKHKKCVTIHGDEANSVEADIELQNCRFGDAGEAQNWIFYTYKLLTPEHSYNSGSEELEVLPRCFVLSLVIILLIPNCFEANIYFI